MPRWKIILSGLLVLQLGAALVLHLTGDDYRAFTPRHKLLTFTPERIDGLRIVAEHGETVLLARRAQQWLLPDHDEFPADGARVQRLLDQLAALEQGWPVATSTAAQTRFKVAEQSFERKLSLLEGTRVVAELYLGTSPSFRQVHARPAGNDAVYAIPFELWELGTTVGDWLAPDTLRLTEDRIARVVMPDFTLERRDQGFHLAELRAEEQPNAEAIRAFVRALSDPRVDSVLDAQTRARVVQDTPRLDFTVTLTDGATWQYRIWPAAVSGRFWLQRSDRPQIFELPEYALQPLLQANREKLLVTTPPAPTPAAAAAAEPSAAPAASAAAPQ